MSWTDGPVVVPHVLRVAVPKLHVPHDLELDTGDLDRLLEQDPGDGLVERRRGQGAQVGPVALAGGEEVGWVQGLLNRGLLLVTLLIAKLWLILTLRAKVSPFLGMSWRTSQSFPNSGCSLPTF